jgi:uncharacterized protein (TIGR01777 family)
VKVTVFGASGFIGRHLTAALRARNDEVVPASLRDIDAAARACDGADAVVNLAGEGIAQRWTPEVKARIRSSRVDAPRALIERFSTMSSPPKAYVSASAIGYYGSSEDLTFSEPSPPGTDFLAQICAAWEAEAAKAAGAGARVAVIRTGLALGTDGGVLAQLLPIFRVGAGGKVGDGRQWYSWIHIDDVVGIYLSAIDRHEGTLNATSPNPVRNADFTHALAAELKRPALIPVPEFALRLRFGEAAGFISKGQRVLPERTLACGYRFQFPTLEEALSNLLATPSRE